jgi:hypothetical protein
MLVIKENPGDFFIADDRLTKQILKPVITLHNALCELCN